MDESTTTKLCKKRQSTPKNTAVYVSNLPNDITIDELVQYFSKCGIIMDEIVSGKPRIKLYCDEDGTAKGDALIVYLREESVTLALNILDEGEIRIGHKIRVQEASFNNNETLTENKSKRSKVDKETWKKHMRKMQKKLEWFDEEAEAQARESARQEKFSKILVLRNMYRPEELTQLDFSVQLSEEIAEECEEKLGITDCSVQVIDERAAEGMCTVKFKKAIEAQAAAKLMNGRMFAGLRVIASIYDGSFALPKKQNLRSGADEEEQARLEAFSKYIEDEEDSEEDSDEEPVDDEESADDVKSVDDIN